MSDEWGVWPDEWWELMHMETGNLVADFGTQAEADAARAAYIEVNPGTDDEWVVSHWRLLDASGRAERIE